PVVARVDPRQERLEGPPASLLDALLPGRRDLATQVAGRVDDVDLGAGEVVHRLGDLFRARRGDDLVADDHRAGGALDLGDHRVPGADGVTGGAAPVLTEQVECGAEVE